MPRIDLTDFSGGINESVSPGDFSERQHSIMKGFVIEDETKLRSQGAVQRISAASDIISVRACQFGGETESDTYLIGITSVGSLKWMRLPTRLASNTTTSALTWTSFSNISGSTAGVNGINPQYRFITQFRYTVANESVTAMLLTSRWVGYPAVVVYEQDDALVAVLVANRLPARSGIVIEVAVDEGGAGYIAPPVVSFVGGGGSGARATAQVRNGAVSSVVVTDAGSGYTSAPAILFDGSNSNAKANSKIEFRADKGCIPAGILGTTYRGQLVIGPIRTSLATDVLTAANVRDYENYLFIAEPIAGGDNTRFDPRFPYRAAEDGVRITGLQETAEGLLVMTTPSGNMSGLILHRGEILAGEAIVEPIRPGQGIVAPADHVRQQQHAWWNETASTVLVDNMGKVQQVRSNEVQRIDRYGPVAPETADGSEMVVAIGSWLFVYRAGRMLVMRSFGPDGAWTELVLPSGLVTSMSAVRDELFFTTRTGTVGAYTYTVWRYCVEGNESERGRVNGELVDLTLGSRTLGNPQEVLEKWWEGLTVRAEGRGSAELRSVNYLSGSPLLNPLPGGASFTLNQSLVPRQEVSVPGLGPSIECSALLVFRGDVRVENLSFDVVAGAERL